MIETLFSSIARVEILKLFLFNPDNSFFQRQISSLTHQSIRGVQREVEKLEKLSLLEKSIQGNRIYYRTNKKCPIFEDLKNIIFKSTGIAIVLQEHLKIFNTIKIAFIYGSYARGEEQLSSDIDLLVIGSISSKDLSSALSRVKKELIREINYFVFPLQEYKKRIRQNDHFLTSVLKDKKIFIVGDENDLITVSKSG